jgi:putative spermidine/putrescine transport system substrate-binding protein
MVMRKKVVRFCRGRLSSKQDSTQQWERKMKARTTKTKSISRRALLKGAAATTGVAITGFPMVWAQNIKDITLQHVGASYSAIIDIARQASADLGFKVEMQNVDGDALINRIVTQPDTVEIADFEYSEVRKVFPRGVMQALDTKRITNWGKIAPIFREGKYPNGGEVSQQGIAPFKVQYTSAQDGTDFTGISDWATMMPQIYNGDTLGIRPDLVGRPIESWGELFNPEFRGKTALVDYPSVGIMDIAMAFEALGVVKYVDKGDMTTAEMDQTFAELIKLKKDGHFRAFWGTFDQSVNLMASGEVVIQPMWSPAVTAIRTRGIACSYVPLKEGYRAWGVGLGLMGHVDGLKRDAAYEYLNWYLSGWQGAFIAKQGYYTPVLETTKAAMTPEEWDYWYDGKPAAIDIKDPYGAMMEKAGATRDGGTYDQRMGNIACWNTYMKENVYLVNKWNEFLTV